ncbi:MAG TPA: aldo/keto reductase [Gemmatimonadaceae bacterium]|nr:aldo/keto reductase [Gemmatimonadaceae bacterium]
MTELLTRAIPSTGERIPAIGLGTWQTFDVGPSAHDRAPLAGVLRELVASGARVVDSSPMYGRAEEVLGALAAEQGLRDRLFVATKVWTTGRREGVAQMEDSFRKLRVEHVDLLQVHNLLDVDAQLATLRDWQAAGRVRYVGVTHYRAEAHAAVMRAIEVHAPDVVQINYSVREREAERRLLPLARERGVAVLVNRPFAEGALLRRLAARPLPPWAAELACESWAQLLLKFVLGHDAVTCVIPATSSVTHLRDDLRAATGPMPDAEMRERIARAAA